MTGDTRSSTADTQAHAQQTTATQDTTQVPLQAQLTDDQKRDIENYIRERFVNIFDYVFDKIPGTDDYFKWDEQELLFGLKNMAAVFTVDWFTLDLLCGEKGYQTMLLERGQENFHFERHGLIPHHIFYDSHSLKLTNIDFNLLHDKIATGQSQDEGLEEKVLQYYHTRAVERINRATKITSDRMSDIWLIEGLLAKNGDAVRNADSARNDIVAEWGEVKKNISEKEKELRDLSQIKDVDDYPREAVLSRVPVLDALITLLEAQDGLTKELTEIANKIAPETAQLLSTVKKVAKAKNHKSQVGNGTSTPHQSSEQGEAERSKLRIFLKVVFLALGVIALGAAQAFLINIPEFSPWLLGLAKVIGATSLVTGPTLGLILLGVGIVAVLTGAFIKTRSKIDIPAPSPGDVAAGSAPTLGVNSATRVMRDGLSHAPTNATAPPTMRQRLDGFVYNLFHPRFGKQRILPDGEHQSKNSKMTIKSTT